MDPKDIALNVSANDLLIAIQLGIGDDRLADLEHEIKRRKRSKVVAFQADQKVKLNEKVSPKYLVGATAVIRRVNKTRVVLDFDPGQNLGRFGSGIGVTCPPDIIELI